MPDQTQPQLGYGKPTEASIDQVNIWMRSTPWYQDQMRAWGQDPGHPTLSKSQSQQLLKMAQAQGVVIDEGNMEVDDHGNFNPKGHKLRNTLIVAGIAAAAIATMGAAGVFAGAAGAGAGAGGAGATGAGLAGAEMGMSAALPGALATVPGIGATTAIGAVGAGSTLGMGAALPGALSTVPGATATTAGAAGTVGALGTAAKVAKGVGTLGQVGNLLGGVGTAIGDAETAAGQNRLDERNSALTANSENIQGQSAFEQQLMNRELAEERQRKDALKNVYRANFTANTPRSPFNPTGPARYSDSYLSTLKNLDTQGAGALSSAPTYATNSMPALRPYTPIDIKDVPGATGTSKGTLSKIGDWVGPGMSTIGAIARLYGRG